MQLHEQSTYNNFYLPKGIFSPIKSCGNMFKTLFIYQQFFVLPSASYLENASSSRLVPGFPNPLRSSSHWDSLSGISTSL